MDQFKKYTIPPSLLQKTQKELCRPPTKFKHQIPQKFVAEFMDSKSKHRGLLLYHNIGSGKTCSAICIAENFKRKKKILVVLPAALESNFRDELRSPCAGSSYMTDAERQRLEHPHLEEDERKALIKKTNQRINKYYTILSYEKFIKGLVDRRVNFQNTLLIIDEVQNLISETGKRYRVLRNKIEKAPNDMRIVLLSGTPIFDRPTELALTLNLLPLDNKVEEGVEFYQKYVQQAKISKGVPVYEMKNQSQLLEKIKGFVSYYKGMPSKTFPTHEIEYVKCKMEPFQQRCYKKVINIESKRSRDKADILNLPNDFFIGSRMISNIAYPNSKFQEKGLASWKGRYLHGDDLKKCSTKFYKLVGKLRKCQGKAFIYSSFVGYGGLAALTRVLDAHGYGDFAKKHLRKPRKGYYALWTGDCSDQYKQKVKFYYNQKDHPLCLILGSPAIKEGVSFKRVRQVHILEPYWNRSRLQQIMGRAIRYCSHADMPRKDQHVQVYIYLAVRDKEYTRYAQRESLSERLSVDRYINYLASSKNHLVTQFERLLQRGAVDCELFKNLNNEGLKGDARIQCAR